MSKDPNRWHRATRRPQHAAEGGWSSRSRLERWAAWLAVVAVAFWTMALVGSYLDPVVHDDPAEIGGE